MNKKYLVLFYSLLIYNIYVNGQDCNVQGCRECQDGKPDTCKECFAGNFEVGGLCYWCVIAPFCYGGCWLEIPEICMQEPQRYYDIHGTKEFKDCPEHCLECDSLNACRDCLFNMKWNSEEDFCYCPADQIFMEDKGCVKDCPDNFFKKNDEECVPCVENCLNCESERCEACEQDYFLHHEDGKCYEELEGYYGDKKDKDLKACMKYCIKCSDEDSCEDCGDKFWDEKSNKCVKKCPQSYFEGTNGQCEECDENCLQCQGRGECEVCDTQADFYLYEKDGMCYDESEQIDGFYADKDEGKFKECMDNCKQCDDKDTCNDCGDYFYDQNEEECVKKCPEKYAGVDGVCEECSKHCLKCEDVHTCLECDVDEGYFLHLDDKKCYDEKDFHFGDESSGQLEQCSTNCVKCDDEHICNECDVKHGWYLDTQDNHCYDVQHSKKGFYPDTATGKWEQCEVQGCKACTFKDTCDDCGAQIWHREDKQCVDECPKGFFAKNGECNKCSSNCDICVNNHECVECHNDGKKNKYYLHKEDLDCHSRKEKLVGLYGDDNTGKLENCPFNCLYCKNADSCDNCGNNKWNSYQKKCQQSCARGEYADESNFCKPCQKGCVDCRSEDICLACDKNHFYVLNNKYECEKKKNDKYDHLKDKNYRWYDNNKPTDKGMSLNDIYNVRKKNNGWLDQTKNPGIYDYTNRGQDIRMAKKLVFNPWNKLE